MKKILSLTLAVLIELTSAGYVYAHNPASNESKLKVEAKKIDKGVNLYVTSKDPETAEYLRSHIPWYERVFRKLSHFGDMMSGHGGMMQGSKKMMHSKIGYTNCPMM